MTGYAIDGKTGTLMKLKQYPMGGNPNWIEIVTLREPFAGIVRPTNAAARSSVTGRSLDPSLPQGYIRRAMMTVATIQNRRRRFLQAVSAFDRI